MSAPVVATTTTTSVAAAEGIWGALGFVTTTTTQVVNPLFIPLVATAGAIVGGAALWSAFSVRRRWRRTTKLLNAEFERFWTEPACGVKLVQIEDLEEEEREAIDVPS